MPLSGTSVAHTTCVATTGVCVRHSTRESVVMGVEHMRGAVRLGFWVRVTGQGAVHLLAAAACGSTTGTVCLHFMASTGHVHTWRAAYVSPDKYV